MKKWIIILMIIPTIACGFTNWDGFPLVDQTNYYDWQAITTNYAPVSQLWQAVSDVWEGLGGFGVAVRYGSFTGFEDDSLPLFAYGVDAPYNISIPVSHSATNDANTNRYIVYTNIPYSLHAYIGGDHYITNYLFESRGTASGSTLGLSNDIVQIGYSFNGTNYSFATDAGYVDFCWDFLKTEDFWEWVSGVQTNTDTIYYDVLYSFVSANAEGGDNFETYFSQTDTNGDVPTQWPLMSVCEIFERNNIGFVDTYETDGFSFCTKGRANRTTAPGMDEGTTLVKETVWNGSNWVDNAGWEDGELNNMAETNIWPIARYTAGGTNAITPITFKVRSSAHIKYLTDATRTDNVTLGTNSDVVLTNRHKSAFDSLSFLDLNADGENVGDTISILYTNAIEYPRFEPLELIDWGGSGNPDSFEVHDLTLVASEALTVYPVILDELYYVLKEIKYRHIRWKNDDIYGPGPLAKWDYGAGSNNVSTWQASSTNSWNDAKTKADAATPLLSTSSTALPRSYSLGTYDGTFWFAQKKAAANYPVAVRVSTNRWDNFKFYIQSLPNTLKTYDGQGEGYPERISYQENITTAATNITGSLYGTTTQPPNWCDEPTVGDSKSKGYYLMKCYGVRELDL